MLPIIKISTQKSETKKPEQVHSLSLIAKVPVRKDDLKID